ncbi:curlin repeat-containing protein [Halomonas sp. ATCH28]|uniref:Curlin repeat-containing protein n=1 Tax=Halomonas gemina TaxID=2945105 RepID=A0ABT0T686_9GAMM|nr:curlin repeat-containing protein [Halomonas gemina]MCL7942302.1 curlin repeat-containing protein [Halomonas gemina]
MKSLTSGFIAVILFLCSSANTYAQSSLASIQQVNNNHGEKVRLSRHHDEEALLRHWQRKSGAQQQLSTGNTINLPWGHQIVILQRGDHNAMEYQGVWEKNSVHAQQLGDENQISLYQLGANNDAELAQHGDNNEMTATQRGEHNILTWHQDGDWLPDLNVIQDGSRVQILQQAVP